MKKFLKGLFFVILALVVIFGGIAVANKINERAMHEYIDSFTAVEYENQLTPAIDENGAPYFVTDDDFKVMQLTDVHIGGSVFSAGRDKMAINMIAAMINTEKPDLVAVTGDISFAVPWSGVLNNRYAHEMFGHIMENLGVYWTVTFGNHDAETYNFYNRSRVADMYESDNLEHCLFNRGPEGLYGECNHYVYVKNTNDVVTRAYIMIDTNAYTDDDPLGFGWIYDNIHQDQIDWYEDSINILNAHNESLGAPEVKSMIFCHIPLMEVRDAYNEYLTNGESDELKYISGEVGEKEPYVYSSEIPDQMFETMVELGSTDAIFYGHDHVNSIMLEYKGITLCYGYSVDYLAYWQIHKQGSQRGCTVINCSPDGGFEIIHENYYQDKYITLYEKEVVDLTN
jgi:hypothetical protein